MKTIMIPIRKYRDNAIIKPQNTFNNFPKYGGIGMRKYLAMPNTKTKGASIIMSQCAPRKTLSMNNAARPASAVMKFNEICYKREQMMFECGKQTSKFIITLYESLSKNQN